MKSYRAFHYFPVDIRQSHSGKNVKGFKFPANGKAYDGNNPADVENLRQMELYFGVNEVIASLEDIMRTGTSKTNKLYRSMLAEVIDDYDKLCIFALSLASNMCWVRSDPDDTSKGYRSKLTIDKALYVIEPAIKGFLHAIQVKLELTFPLEIVKNIAKLDIEREILEIEETTGVLQKELKRKH